MPTTIQAFLLLVLLVLPGYLTVRVSARVHNARALQWNEVLIHSIGFGFIILVFVAWWLGSELSPIVDLLKEPASKEARKKAIEATLGWWPVLPAFIIAPLPLGILWGGLGRTDLLRRTVNFTFNRVFRLEWSPIVPAMSTPEVWDTTFSSDYQRWVRIKIGDEILEGLIQEASSYPHPKQLFLTNVQAYDDAGKKIDGRFPEALLGVLIKDDGIQVIEVYK